MHASSFSQTTRPSSRPSTQFLQSRRSSLLVPRPLPLRLNKGYSRTRVPAAAPAAPAATAATPSSNSNSAPSSSSPTTTKSKVADSSSDGSSSSLSVADLARPVLTSHGWTQVSSTSSSSSSNNSNIGVNKRYSAAFQVADLPPPKAPPRGGGGGGDPNLEVLASVAVALAAGLGCGYGVARLKKNLDTPGRPWLDDTTVGREYDAWTEEEILEYYWGEHIHLGYYQDEDLEKGAGTLLGCKVKDFIEAKLDFVDEMREWSGVSVESSSSSSDGSVGSSGSGTGRGRGPAKVLDVGCGIGGASRRLAATFGSGTQVTGITLSPKQAQRAGQLALDQGIPNADFKVMDALAMDFPDDTFDFVWACESGEHMPDKGKYVEEMVRVLKPGGTLVIATWCQRKTPPDFTTRELVNLRYLYEEWAHPYFISISDYAMLVKGTMQMDNIVTDDWTKQTIASWRHSIWAGVWDPLPVFTRPRIWYKTLRDIVCLERMRRAFGVGLMQYGMIKATKMKR